MYNVPSIDQLRRFIFGGRHETLAPGGVRWLDHAGPRLHHLELKLANRLEEIVRVHEAVNTLAEREGLDAATRRQLNVVFDELLNNTISYGYDDDGEHRIEVTVTIADGRLLATIRDDGRPYDPFARPAPDTTLSLEERPVGGLGVHLVRAVLDHVSYERRGNMNVVRLEKQLQPAGY